MPGMQSFMSLARAVMRIVFRSGSPQRIQYSAPRMIATALSFVVLAIASQITMFQSDPIEVGLFLFTCLTGLYIGAALLTRKVPRARLRVSLLAVLAVITGSQLLLLLLAPLADLFVARRQGVFVYGVALLSGVLVLVGVANCLKFALGSNSARAWTYTLSFAGALIAFYATLYPLLQIVFA